MLALHLADDLLREGASLGAHAEQDRGFHVADDVGQCGLAVHIRVRVRVRVGQLVLGKVLSFGALVSDKAGAVHEVDALARLLDGLARLLGDGARDEVGDADTGLSGTVEEECLVLEFHASEPLGSEEPSEHDRGGALDVIIEAGALVLVLVQEAEGVLVAKVLELQQHLVAVLVARSRDELVHELIVGRAAIAVVAQPDVARVGEELLVVRANVDVHRQAGARVDAGAGRIERQLADGDAHAIHAEVAEPEDTLAVGEDDGGNVLLRPVVQHLADVTLVPQTQVEAPRRLGDDLAPLLACLAHRRRVHERHELGHVAHEQRVVEVRMAALDAREHQVLVNVRGLRPDALNRDAGLHLQVKDASGHQAFEAARVALGRGECEPLVAERRPQQPHALLLLLRCRSGGAQHHARPGSAGRRRPAMLAAAPTLVVLRRRRASAAVADERRGLHHQQRQEQHGQPRAAELPQAHLGRLFFPSSTPTMLTLLRLLHFRRWARWRLGARTATGRPPLR
mmetsp:Transcript_25597/g.80132  ORF Transcript_25597/g.80132 Transcript_25597/m.80132 type:complete len:512 (+) Transcript_25597:550-2085(+)